MSVDVAELQIKIGANGVDKAKRDLDGLTSSGKKAESATNLLTAAMKGLAAGLASIGIGAVVREMIQLADQYTNLSGRVRLVTGSTAAATSAMNDLYAISQRTRVGLSSTVDLYTSLSRSTQALGVSQAQVKQITETINQALIVSGTSAAAASGSLAQLGQAFASGALRGDELNSIMEGMPRVAQAIADGMGITIGKLRELGAEGKLTSEVIFNALTSQSEKIKSEFSQMGVTVDQAVTQVGNALLMMVGKLNDATGASKGLVSIIGTLSEFIDTFATATSAADVEMAKFTGTTTQAVSVGAVLVGVFRTVLETLVVLGANVGYVFGAIYKDIASLAVQGKMLMSLDFGGMKAEAQRRTAEAAAERKAVDAFSAAILARKSATVAAAGADVAAALALAKPTAATVSLTKAKKDSTLATIDLIEADRSLIGTYMLFGEKVPEVAGELKTMNDMLQESGVQVEDLKTEFELASEQMAEAFYSVSDAVDYAFRALKHNDWVGVLLGIADAVKRVQEAFKAGASSAEKFGAVAGVISSVGGMIGGKTGGFISGAASGASAGFTLTGSNPIGAVVGGIIGGISSLFGSKKPSNNGALATFSGDSFSLSGNKRTDETSQMATAAANAILQGRAALQAAGLTLNTSVQSIDMGTRDATDIILTNGKALTAAVGDAAAAAETALKAMLDGATYASDAQKALVDSMVAAGKGFDDIAAGLQTFNDTMKAAQGLGQSIADQILKLTNPQAYDVTMLTRSQEARQSELKAYLDGGFLSGDQFKDLSAQLEILNGLEMADVLKRYTDTAENQLADGMDRLASVASAATSALSDAAKQWADIAKSLGDYRRSLIGAEGFNSPLAAYGAARNDFRTTSASAMGGNASSAAGLQSVAEAYLKAAQEVSPDTATYRRAVNEVLGVLSATEAVANNQAGFANQGLYQVSMDVQAVRAEIAVLRADMAAAMTRIAEGNEKTAKASEKTAAILTRVTQDGESLQTTAAA